MQHYKFSAHTAQEGWNNWYLSPKDLTLLITAQQNKIDGAIFILTLEG